MSQNHKSKANKNNKQRQDPNKRKKLKKDIGAPNLQKFKVKFDRKIEQNQQKNNQRMEKVNNLKRKRSELDDYNSLSQNASDRGNEFANKEEFDASEVIMNKTTDNSRKSFYKEFKKVAKSADVILEVLDARDPLGTRSVAIERQIMAMDPNKKIILVLNKIDLVPKKNIEGWLKYLRNSLPTVAFKASTQKQRSNIGVSNTRPDKLKNSQIGTTTECLGAESLMSLLKNYSRSHDLKKSILVGIVGFPNVGKSSIINSLKRTKAVAVGATPGLTKVAQEIYLDHNIKLLDCPGILFDPGLVSESDAALRNCIKIEQIEDPLLPIEAVVKRCSKDKLCELYEIGNYEDVTGFLNLVGQKTGKVMQGGVSNLAAAAKLVLKDWNTGKIPYYTIPPETEGIHLDAKIVQSWGPEIDLNSIMDIDNDVLGKLNDVSDGSSFPIMSVPSNSDVMDMDDSMEDVETDENNGDSNIVIGDIKKKKEKEENPFKRRKLNTQINKEIRKTVRETKKEEMKSNKLLEGERIEPDNLLFGSDFWTKPNNITITNEVPKDSFTF